VKKAIGLSLGFKMTKNLFYCFYQPVHTVMFLECSWWSLIHADKACFPTHKPTQNTALSARQPKMESVIF